MPIATVEAPPAKQAPQTALDDRAARQQRGPNAAWRKREDRGSSSVEFTILFPIIVVLLFGGPQLAMWYFAREAAQSAASSAARAACVLNAPGGAGKQAADTFLSKVGTDTINSYNYTEATSATSVSVRIHITVPRVIPLPGFNPAADVHVTCGKERFTTPDSP
jgi:Flp pilus assembly protein TadG